MDTGRQSVFVTRLRRRLFKFATNRKVVRYGIVSLNLLLLLAIGVFTLGGTQNGQPLTSHAALRGGSNGAGEPLDQLSSADIAANASIATGLAETTAVINQADSAKADLSIAPADTTVVAKPQPVATALKSRKDIQNYVVPADTTVADIAAKFSVTSDSVTWSNNLNSSTVKAGTKLVLLPGVNGIVYIVKDGDTVDSLAQKYRASRDQIILYNDVELAPLQVGEQIFIPNGQQPAAPSAVVAFSYLGGTAQFGGYNGYDYGFCTYYAAMRRAQLGNPVPSNLGNANTWAYRAAAFGIPTGSVPKPGAVAMKHSGAPGHVAIVEAVNDDGSFWISEMNSYGQRSMTDSTPYGGWGRVDWKLIPASFTGTYTYIY